MRNINLVQHNSKEILAHVLNRHYCSTILSRKLKQDLRFTIREMVKCIMVYLYHEWIEKNEVYLGLLIQKYISRTYQVKKGKNYM